MKPADQWGPSARATNPSALRSRRVALSGSSSSRSNSSVSCSRLAPKFSFQRSVTRSAVMSAFQSHRRSVSSAWTEAPASTLKTQKFHGSRAGAGGGVGARRFDGHGDVGRESFPCDVAEQADRDHAQHVAPASIFRIRRHRDRLQLLIDAVEPQVADKAEHDFTAAAAGVAGPRQQMHVGVLRLADEIDPANLFAEEVGEAVASSPGTRAAGAWTWPARHLSRNWARRSGTTEPET